MPRHYRRILFWGCILLFLITAPLLILHTAGYRYNWERGKIQETGVLLLDYKPKDATIVLNRVERGTKAPLRLSGLTPGRYTIAVQKEGFASWEKRLWVEPSKTTFAQHMVLWKKNITPARLNEHTPALIAPSPDKKRLAVVEKETPTSVLLVDTDTGGYGELLTLPLAEASITKLLWSPRGRRLFAETANGGQFIFTLDSGSIAPIALRRFIQSTLERVLWNASDDDRLYGYRRTGLRQGYALVEIDFSRGAVRPSSIVMEKKVPYAMEDDLLYRIEGDALIIAPLLPSRALERRLPLPSPTMKNAQFLTNGPDAVLTIFDSDQKRLFLIDKETRTLYPIQEMIDGAISAMWSPARNRLVWTTGKEIWLLDLEQSTRELMIAESATGGKKIQDIAWNPGNEYVFYTTDGAMNVVEIDNRDNRNRTTLATVSGQKGLWTSNNGTKLWTMERGAEGKKLLSLAVTDR